MSIKHILFDLDGTLLPMVQDEFVRFYMPLLAKAYLKKGVEMDPKGFIGAVWKGYEAMVKNDGSRTNREAFWSYIDEFLPLSVEESEAIADAFYEDEFNQAKCTTQPTPLSDMVIKEAKKKGIEVYLATNPIFPRCATMNRIDWADWIRKILRLLQHMKIMYIVSQIRNISVKFWNSLSLIRQSV